MSKSLIKIATEEDLPLVLEMALKFAEKTNYSDVVSRDEIEKLLTNLLRAPKDKAVIFIYEDKGLLLATVSKFLHGDFLQATELAWWVDPAFRKAKVGKALLEAFEYWAEKVGAKVKVMSCLDSSVAKYYEKNGYKLYERVYFKEV